MLNAPIRTYATRAASDSQATRPRWTATAVLRRRPRSRSSLACGVAFATLLPCSALLAQNASGFRGPGGQGLSPAAALPARFQARHVQWRVPAGGTGHGSPVVFGQRIYLTRVLGDVATPRRGAAEPAKKAQREVVCFDLASGKELWAKAFAFVPHRQHRFNNFASSTPAVDKDGVYVLWTSGQQLEAMGLDHRGKPLWRNRLGEYFAGHGSGSSPVVAGNTLLVANENEGEESALFGLDKKTGVTLWKRRRESMPRRGSFATPLLVERKGQPSFALFASTSHGLCAVDPETGKFLWEFNPKFRQRFVATPVVGAGHVMAFAGSGGGGKESVLLRLPSKAGEKPVEVSRPRRVLPYVPCALPIGDRFYLVSDGGVASCRNAKTGEIVWRERLDGTFFGSPVSDGETIYVISREGKLVSYAVGDEFALHGSFELGAPSYTTPAIAGDSLVVRTRSELIRLGATRRGTKKAREAKTNTDSSGTHKQGKERAESKPHRYPELSTIAKPSARDPKAINEDWPCFLGARRDSRSRETSLLRAWPEAGPNLVWSMRRGESYASPVFGAGRMIYVHRVGPTMHVDCLEPETGLRHWRFSYPCRYKRGKYISNKGQRSSAVIAKGHVFVHGVGGMLYCLDLAKGKRVWKRDLSKDYAIGDDYFGAVSSPLIHGDLLIQNLGGDKGHSVAAFDVTNGELRWGTGPGWGASCSSPVIGRVHGKERVFVLAGGLSRPPTGGLLVVDPSNGKVDFRYPFRSRRFESVNAAPPAVGDNWVFLSVSYGVGSAILALDDNGGFEERWRSRKIGLQFVNPVVVDGYIYCVEGRGGRSGAFVCIDGRSGKIHYRKELNWDETVELNGDPRSVPMSVGEGSLLHVDGAFLCHGDRGHLLRIEATPKAAKVTSRHWMFRALESWTPPVVHNGLLYLCQNNPEVYGGSAPARLLCYDLRARAE